jgi:general stress protein 26
MRLLLWTFLPIATDEPGQPGLDFLWYLIWSYTSESRSLTKTNVMATNQQLNFLQEKIQEIGSAIFFNLSNSVLKLPTSLVTTLKVDDFGFVWFFIQKPKQQLTEFESEFPVRLDFFKKGKDYFLQVVGKGRVVTDPEEMNSFVSLPEEAKQVAMHDMVLVKVKIQKAEYYETRTASNHTWWQSAVNMVSTWFRNSHNYKGGDTFYPAS